MRILVCGGRNLGAKEGEEKMVMDCLTNLFPNNPPPNPLPWNTCIITGGARGADSIARAWAEDCSVRYEEYPADWQRFGKKAGPIRNRKMLEDAKPDLVVAFPGGRGTAHMIQIAKEAGIEVREIEYKN